MSEYTIILNPNAGKGGGRRLLAPLEKILKSRAIRYTLCCTSGPGEATDLARHAKGAIVVAVGGDGTVNEVVNGLMGLNKTLGIIPGGSGNDFIKSINVPRDFDSAVATLLKGTTRMVDVGTIEWQELAEARGEQPEPRRRHFINGIGVGFDAAVAARTTEIKYLTGTPLYVAAVLRTLGTYRAPLFEMGINGQTSSSHNLLIAIGNGRCAGGGFYLTPDASVDDGLLDLCIIDDVKLSTILRLMPKVMRGKHLGEPMVNYLKTKEFHISSEEPFYVHADGEIIGRNVVGLRLGVLQRTLPVIVGEEKEK